MNLRNAEPSDAAALSKLAVETYCAAFGHSFSVADLAAHLERNLSKTCFEKILEEDTVLVAETKNSLIGFLQFGATKLSAEAVSNDAELRRLYVHSNFQNEGVGTRLMDVALEHPTLKNAERVFLDVWEHNHGAQRFYARYGFKTVGTQTFEVASGAETSLDLMMVLDRSG